VGEGGVSFPKPLRGTALLEKRQRRADTVAHERREMTAAKRRDGGKCRRPRCGFKTLPVDACHLQHRGAGGNPKGDRTTQNTVIALCRVHHGMYDRGDLRIEPLTGLDFGGPCEFYERETNIGSLEHIGTEKVIGVSVAVGA